MERLREFYQREKPDERPLGIRLRRRREPAFGVGRVGDTLHSLPRKLQSRRRALWWVGHQVRVRIPRDGALPGSITRLGTPGWRELQNRAYLRVEQEPRPPPRSFRRLLRDPAPRPPGPEVVPMMRRSCALCRSKPPTRSARDQFSVISQTGFAVGSH